MPPSTPPGQDSDRRIRKIRRPLLRWYDANRRDLPWRRSSDPYAIWISEAMLQQTRVETVIPYWHRFLASYPTVESLARADLDDVYVLWTGLGYYSRARNLKYAAETVVANHQGRLPDSAEKLRELKGIGRYTAGAIASIAFGLEEPLVDGNVIRVFARVLGIRTDTTSKDVISRLWDIAGLLVRGTRPGDLNQALMELGAILCSPRKPDCGACPIQKHCDAYVQGDAESLPIKKRKPKPKPMRAVAAWIERDGKILVVRRPEKGLMAGLWEFPGGEIGLKEEGKDRCAEILQEVVGLGVRDPISAGHIEHIFTHRRLDLEVFRCRARPAQRVARSGYTDHRWIAPNTFLELAHAGSTRKAMRLLGLTDEISARNAKRKMP
ncbi:MAG TPA: A/G-specific adenine glycosylase [Myxococcales bacterium]|nr:A/G-specific adenine glycosylase [Myxococcales bacterium]